MRDEEDKVLSESFGQFAVIMVGLAATTTFSLSCFAQIGLKRLIDSFKNLQIIVHVMLIDLFTVANCETFFSYLLMITNL